MGQTMKRTLMLFIAFSLLLTSCSLFTVNSEEESVIDKSSEQESAINVNSQNGEKVEILIDQRLESLEIRQQRLLDSIIFSTEEGAYNVDPEYCSLEDIERIICEPEHQAVLSYDEALIHWVESDLGQENLEYYYQYRIETPMPEAGYSIEKVTEQNGEFYYIINDEIYCYPHSLRVEPESFMIGELDIYGIMFYFDVYVGEIRDGFLVCSYGDSPTPLL